MINGQELDYNPIELPNRGNQFKVDGRYQIVIDNIVAKRETVIDCILQYPNLSALSIFSEPGEDLAVQSYMINNMKLSIGAQGDIPGVCYEYLSDRLRIKILNYASISKFVIYFAWLTMENIEKEEIYTWIGADPTLG